jgi:RHS repeat-associated protein
MTIPLTDPFPGNTISKSGLLADANLYRFSSKEQHLNSGLAYYLYRYYDPNLQRWLNRDPLGCAATQKGLHLILAIDGIQGRTHPFAPADQWPRIGPDLYRYDANDPINSIDPYGLWTFQVGFTVGGNFAGWNFYFSTGFSGDTQGNFGGFYTGGGGLATGVGTQVFGGVTLQGSNAKCNNDLKGPFAYGSVGGGLGPYGSGDAFWGNSPDGPVVGIGGTVGVGLGAGGSAGISGTGIKPIW